jgi:hypothetical protein
MGGSASRFPLPLGGRSFGYMRRLPRFRYIHKAPWYARRFGTNVGRVERFISVLAALALTAFGSRQRTSRRMNGLAAGFLMRRGVTGSCPLYRRIGLTSA